MLLALALERCHHMYHLRDYRHHYYQQQQQQGQGPHLSDAPSLGTGETSTCQTHQTSSPAPKVLDKLGEVS